MFVHNVNGAGWAVGARMQLANFGLGHRRELESLGLQNKSSTVTPHDSDISMQMSVQLVLSATKKYASCRQHIFTTTNVDVVSLHLFKRSLE